MLEDSSLTQNDCHSQKEHLEILYYANVETV